MNPAAFNLSTAQWSKIFLPIHDFIEFSDPPFDQFDSRYVRQIGKAKAKQDDLNTRMEVTHIPNGDKFKVRLTYKDEDTGEKITAINHILTAEYYDGLWGILVGFYLQYLAMSAEEEQEQGIFEPTTLKDEFCPVFKTYLKEFNGSLPLTAQIKSAAREYCLATYNEYEQNGRFLDDGDSVYANFYKPFVAYHLSQLDEEDEEEGEAYHSSEEEEEEAVDSSEEELRRQEEEEEEEDEVEDWLQSVEPVPLRLGEPEIEDEVEDLTFEEGPYPDTSKCSEALDYVSQVEWTEESPTVFINLMGVYQTGRFNCYNGENLRQWLANPDNTFAKWVKRPLAKKMDESGHGGQPDGQFKFYKLYEAIF